MMEWNGRGSSSKLRAIGTTMERESLLPVPCPQPRDDAIKQMIEGANLLLASPREALLPFQDSIIAIDHQIRSVLSDVNRSGAQSDSMLSPACRSPIDPLTSRHVVGAREPSARPSELIKDVLLSGASQFESFKAELLILQHQPFNWFTQDPRIMHLYPILTLQRKRTAQSVKLRDRLLLVGSCMSLADDFHTFEQSHGWLSKQEILIADFLNGCVPAVQKIGKHLRSFLATMNTPMIDERRLDAGIRLGTKLNVAEGFGKKYGLGSSLTLVLGFEVSRLSRLPFQALTALNSIQPPTEGSESVLLSSKDFGPWWLKFRRSYALKFANLDMSYSDGPLGNALDKEILPNVPGSSETLSEKVSSSANPDLSRPNESLGNAPNKEIVSNMLECREALTEAMLPFADLAAYPTEIGNGDASLITQIQPIPSSSVDILSAPSWPFDGSITSEEVESLFFGGQENLDGILFTPNPYDH